MKTDSHLQKALQGYLQSHGHPSATVGTLRELAGGASCRIYAFELEESGTTRSLVLRQDAVGGGTQGSRLEEHALLAAAARAGVTVPAVHCAGSEAEGLGSAFFVMDLVEGEALARRLLRDDAYAATRAALPREIARELARTHSMDPLQSGLEFLVDRAPDGDDPRRFALAEVAHYRQLLDAFSVDQPYPLLRLTARWLEQNAPSTTGPAVVHGDFRVGNLMFDTQGLTAVLDWELSHIGDPIEDLGWFCVRTWRFGNVLLTAGGLCSREELLALYEKAGGAPCDAAHLAWWELFGNWKWAIICRMQAERHRAGRWPDVELATIGRRVAETEHEILSLLDAALGN